MYTYGIKKVDAISGAYHLYYVNSYQIIRNSHARAHAYAVYRGPPHISKVSEISEASSRTHYEILLTRNTFNSRAVPTSCTFTRLWIMMYILTIALT